MPWKSEIYPQPPKRKPPTCIISFLIKIWISMLFMADPLFKLPKSARIRRSKKKIDIPGEIALGTAARSASGVLCLWALPEFWTLLFLRGCSDILPPLLLSVFCRTDRLSSSASAISGLRIFFNLGFVKSSKIRANCSGSMSSSDLSAVFFFWLLLEFGFPLRKEDEDWLGRLLL